MLETFNIPLPTSDDVFIASCLIYKAAPTSHFRVCFLGPVLLATVIGHDPQERDSGVEIPMQTEWKEELNCKTGAAKLSQAP